MNSFQEKKSHPSPLNGICNVLSSESSVKLASTMPSHEKRLSRLNVLSSESSVKLASTMPSHEKRLSRLNSARKHGRICNPTTYI